MNKEKLGTILIFLGFLSILFAPIGSFFHFLPKSMDTLYLLSIGVVFISSGTLIKKKKPL